MTIKCECGMDVAEAWMTTGKHQNSLDHNARMGTLVYQHMRKLEVVVEHTRFKLDTDTSNR